MSDESEIQLLLFKIVKFVMIIMWPKVVTKVVRKESDKNIKNRVKFNL